MTITDIQPKVTLVGAGPGDPDLITVRGLRAITDADVILYDALANRSLLKYAPSSAEKVFVGKRAGQHSHSQDHINKLLAQYALNRGHVVRLKGGDPFVFGRGHEELEYAQSLGIDVTVVPGISSAIAMPEMQHIPLTRRGVSQSFWVITGTTKAGELSGDIALAAQSTATVVVLMGMKKLREIAAVFTAFGREKTPVGIISNGSLPDERTLFGTIGNIADRAEADGIGAPAIIVIGDVVKFHREVDLSLFDQTRLSLKTLNN